MTKRNYFKITILIDTIPSLLTEIDEVEFSEKNQILKNG
jgi:hypothetical protein